MKDNNINQTKINNTIIKKFLRNIIIVSALIIFVSSIETLILAKSSGLIKTYLELNKEATVSDYLNVVTINYFMSILEPVLITLFSFFTLKKYGISKLYKVVFTILLLLRLVNIVLSFRTSSIFYYLIIILYLLLLYFIASTPETKRKRNYGIF